MELLREPIKIKNNRNAKNFSKRNEAFYYNDYIKGDDDRGIHDIIMKKVWKQNYNPQRNQIIQSKVLKGYYQQVEQEAIKIQKKKKNSYKDGRDRDPSKSKKVSLKNNPYASAFNKLEQIMRKNLIQDLFEFNQRKNARMSQGEINAWKKNKNK